ncbi:MAG: hypothetical protein KF797_09375, partial [Flavobacteriales bacterium]|nr:hypothetical protein [Flavobacteriales bacterium]
PGLGGPPIVGAWTAGSSEIGGFIPADLPCGPFNATVVYGHGTAQQQSFPVTVSSSSWYAIVNMPGLYHVLLSMGNGPACTEGHDVMAGPFVDFNNDGTVDHLDHEALQAHFGCIVAQNPDCSLYDLDDDGVVGQSDMQQFNGVYHGN